MSLTDDVKPGEARCPGHPTTKELIKGDKGGAPKHYLRNLMNSLVMKISLMKDIHHKSLQN